MPEAFVTLATTDAYCRGSLVVGKCLRRHGTTRKLVVMVSSNISREARKSLEDVFDEVIVVDVLDSRDSAHLSWLRRPDLGVSFTKIHCWTLTHYTKCVFLDADTLVLCNVDELFEREELSAAPDPGWPDCFNSGVFVFRPSLNTYLQLLEHADLHGSFDGGDQGLLNSFFSDWAIKDISRHLPFIYNLSASALYTYLPAFHKYGHQAKIIHFLGESKPWHFPKDQKQSGMVASWDPNRNLEPYLKLWWKEYYSQSQENRQQPLAALQTAPQPQSQQTGPEAQSTEEETLSQSLGDLTLNLPGSSSCHQPEEMLSSDLSDAQESDPSELQDLLFDQEEDEMGEEPTESDTTLLMDHPAHQDNSQTLQAAEESEEDSEEESEEDSEEEGEEDSEEEGEEDSEEAHRRRWEEGRADYLGKDAFENIQRRLNQFLN